MLAPAVVLLQQVWLQLGLQPSDWSKPVCRRHSDWGWQPGLSQQVLLYQRLLLPSSRLGYHCHVPSKMADLCLVQVGA